MAQTNKGVRHKISLYKSNHSLDYKEFDFLPDIHKWRDNTVLNIQDNSAQMGDILRYRALLQVVDLHNVEPGFGSDGGFAES